MAHPYWPLFDLRIRTARLELRVPTDEDLVALARLAARGIHPPDSMPFAVPWTDRTSPDLERGLLRWHWRIRAALEPDEWWIDFAVLAGGVFVGAQSMTAKQFRVLRTVETGSWVGRELQRRGYGKEMRSAILHLAFAGLGAEAAVSSCFEDNAASRRVSLALGYSENGRDRAAPRGVARELVRFRVERARWEAGPRPAVEVGGLEPCLPLLGIAARGADAP
jgi:RimJ/RimL family protein N-acetyltransferase